MSLQGCRSCVPKLRLIGTVGELGQILEVGQGMTLHAKCQPMRRQRDNVAGPQNREASCDTRLLDGAPA